MGLGFSPDFQTSPYHYWGIGALLKPELSWVSELSGHIQPACTGPYFLGTQPYLIQEGVGREERV